MDYKSIETEIEEAISNIDIEIGKKGKVQK